MSEDESADDPANADDTAGVDLGKATPTPAAHLPPPPAESPKPSKAEKLEAKAARLREAAERRAEQTAAGEVPARRGLLLATVALGVVAVALATLLIITFLAWQHQKDVNTSHGKDATATATARDAALDAAKSFAVDFGSYDYQHLDTEFQEVADLMTPDFAKSYLETSGKLKHTFEQYKTQVTARVQGYGVTSATATTAVVVVFLDQTVHTSQSATPRIDRNRLEIHLEKTDGTWLVSKLLAK